MLIINEKLNASQYLGHYDCAGGGSYRVIVTCDDTLNINEVLSKKDNPKNIDEIIALCDFTAKLLGVTKNVHERFSELEKEDAIATIDDSCEYSLKNYLADYGCEE